MYGEILVGTNLFVITYVVFKLKFKIWEIKFKRNSALKEDK